MSNPQIPTADNCSHTDLYEYWHENDSCDLDDCAVNECNACGVFATECGQFGEA
jgi:hypothetical protein